MADEHINLRLVRSRRVISGWEVIGPSGRVEDGLRMIREEVVVLERIAAEHPEKAATVLNLVQRYQALAASLKAKAH